MHSPLVLPNVSRAARPTSPTLGLIASTMAVWAGTAAPALGQFHAPRELTAAIPTALDAILVDMDADGDLDALATSQFLELDAWFENDGFGVFGNRSVVSSTLPISTALVPVDLDGDGILDFVRCSQDGEVQQFRGIGGGSFAPPVTLTHFNGSIVSPGAALAHDLDLDGDVDLVYGLLSGGVHVQANLGGGNFAPPTLVSGASEGVYSLAVGDLDGDLRPEIVYGSLAHEQVRWLPNLGGLSFSGAQSVGNALDTLADVAVTDLDGDGDQDLLAAAELSHRLVWFENAGAGAFGAAQVLSSVARPARFAFADVDGDVDLDLVVAHRDLVGLLWYERIAGTAFAAPRVVAAGATFQAVAAGDIDGDGRVDLLVASSDDSLAWHRNDATTPLFGASRPIGQETLDVQSVAAGDVDGDGAMDVLAASPTDDQLAWFRQLGGGDFAALAVLDDACDGCSLVRTGDLRRIGRTDIVYIAGDTSTIYLRRAGALNVREALGNLPYAIADLELADLDADGDLDMVVAADAVFALWNLGSTFTAPVQISAPASAAAIELGDLVGDALPDVLTLLLGVEGSNTIRLQQNLGAQAFGPPLSVASTAYVADLELADMDLDGDPDPVWVSSLARRVYWRASGGNGTFGPTQDLGLLPDYGFHLRAADLDSDGDEDLLVGLSYDLDLQWFERTAGGYAPLRPVAVAGFVTYTTDVADLDADGDLDVVFGSRDSDSVHWVPTDFGSPIGSVDCGPGALNSSGSPSVLYATGDVAVAANDLVLTGRQLPPGTFGYSLASLVFTPPTPAGGGAGLLCLGAPIGRLIGPGQVQQASPTGTMRIVVGTQALPQPMGSVPVLPGQSWYFQLWHRDGASSNFSNSIRIDFQ
jgi:hypothetical protein